MTITPPAPNVVTPLVTGFPENLYPYSNITPFTYRDGLTYLEVLQGLRSWLERVLVPWVNSNVGGLSEAWNTEISDLVDAVNGEIAILDGMINDLSSAVTDAQTAATGASISAAAAAASATAAAGSATAAAGSAASLTDDALADRLSDQTNPFGIALDAAVAAYLNADISDSKTASIAITEAVIARANIYNILDYGGIADAGTGNADAIYSAFTAMGGNGGMLIIPPGEYGLDRNIIIPQNTEIRGYGATIHRLPGFGAMFTNFDFADTTTTEYNGSSNIVIRGLTIECHGDTNTINMNAITFNHCKNVLIEDLIIRNCIGYHPIEVNSVDGAVIQRVRFEGYIPVSGLTEKEAIQIDCAISGSVDSGALDGTVCRNISIRDIVVTSNGVFGAQTVAVGSHAQGNDYYDNINIDNVFCDGVSARPIAAYWWKNSNISNVVIEGSGSTGVRVLNCTAVTISECSVVGAYTQGISVSTSSVNCVVSNNYVESANEGIYLGQSSDRTRVIGNSVRHTPSYGITINGSNNALIEANTIDGAGYTIGATSAVRVSGTADNTSIIGNKVLLHASGTEVTYGASVATTATNAMVFGNDFLGLSAAIGGVASTTSNRIV